MAFAAYFLSMILFVYLDGWHTRELDRPMRFLLALPVLLVLLKLPYQKNFLWYGVIFGALGAFCFAVFDRWVLGQDRANGFEHPIMFGNTSLLLGGLSFCAFLYFKSEKNTPVLTVLAFMAALCGVFASLLSGTRGGWISLPIICVFILWQSRDLLDKKIRIWGACLLIALGVSIVSVPQFGVAKRLHEVVTDIERYQTGDFVYNSVGQRFEMWKGAVYMFKMAPVLGVGEYHSVAIKQKLADQGLISESILRFSHAHNEYLTSLSLRGIVGLLFLLLVYLVPLKLFLNKVRSHQHNWNVKAYALAGALIPMSYMDFALTQSMFSHNIGVMFYAFSIVFFWAATRWVERD
ncbi:O-antigen ligase family protein [Marinomonas sp. 15G1-11]|uniref:O-antigen ligase family protein n=1 Tax=Marinomonas phaeophyticola TaxID=3004091 RepID=A0ABT4JRL2_9GAMM|nr:O-antigen ligase family protein [Marinomonas sp. 15G1-11]MCZ2720979.1 O-antigen ligase family protein [Marinomonas sp. 15G1-11]